MLATYVRFGIFIWQPGLGHRYEREQAVGKLYVNRKVAIKACQKLDPDYKLMYVVREVEWSKEI